MPITMKAGFAKIDVTPAYSVPLGGYGNTHERMHTTVLDPIYAICVAVSDGESKALIYNLDQVGFDEVLVEECKSALFALHGIPGENILFNASHTHSAPDLTSPLECIATYRKELVEKVIAVAAPALADLEDCRIFIGSGRVEGLTFVRRYLLSDGTYGGDNFGDFVNNTILGHESSVDDEMQVVRFEREGKKDILLVNWQGHPHRTGGATTPNLSSDLVEYFRLGVEGEHGVLMAFIQGCGGNINHNSRVKEEMRASTHIEVGKALAEGIRPILAGMREVRGGKIRATVETFTGEVNHAWDDKVPVAEEIVAFRETHTRKETTAFAVSKGFNSVYHASAVIRKSKMPKTDSYLIGALAFGDVCIAWTPNELYDTTGKYIKATSPFEMTFACGYTNGRAGYMPTIKAYAHGGYGCDTCRFPAGTTEKLTNCILEQILKVKE
ncbi:MAG: hypothetical protein IKD18_00785 [Clostridia bacterium]|nr:hypothetical protein [Clostridia bacterium]